MRRNISEKSKRILLVEDSRLSAMIASELLYNNGYDVENVSTGEEAVQMISGGFPTDLVLMDIELAGKMDGIDAARRILKSRDIPIVFLTANTSDEIIDKIKEVKAYGFVLKDKNKAALLSTVEMALKLHEANIYIEDSRKQYFELAENAPIGILKCDIEGNISYVNQKVLEILGSPSIEETKKINLLAFPLLVQNGFSEKLKECMENNKSGTYEINYKTKWDKKVWGRIHIKPLTDKDIVTGAQVIIDDITETKRLEEENKQKEERIHLMLKGIPNPTWLVSKERRILMQNKAAESLFNTKVGDYCWKSIYNGKYLSDEYREAFEKNGLPLPGTKCCFCLGDAVLKINEPLSSEVELSGSVWDMWWIPLGHDVYLHYASDITKYKKMEEALRLLCETDCLVNAYNRRYFIKKLEDEIERVRRNNNKLSLIMIDIDRFKSINDKFGHNAGDLVLKSVVELIGGRIRKTDTLARWGGEEFVILLPDTPVSKAAILAEELRKSISNRDIPDVGRVTASFGAAGYCPGDNADTLVNKADQMMYEAKAAGRNCVRCMTECE